MSGKFLSAHSKSETRALTLRTLYRTEWLAVFLIGTCSLLLLKQAAGL